MRELQTDILIVGAGLGGIAGALAACRLGRHVILTEESAWVGGQLTTQCVPPDENPWIDSDNTGCTASYRKFRDGVRSYYRRNYPLLEEVKREPHFNPGMGNVSPLCHEPLVALAVLHELIAPYIANGQLSILHHVKPIAADTDRDFVRAITLRHTQSEDWITIRAAYIIDATELGDLLEIAQIEHVMGAESQAETGELHALETADPMDQQSHSWCFALSYYPDEDHTIDKPASYDFWVQYRADFWPGPLLSWTTSDPITLEPVTRPIFTGPTDAPNGDDLWHFRRIIYRKFYPDGFHRSDVVVVNWPQLDYWLGPLVGVSTEDQQKHWFGAHELANSLFFWMQTECPRPDGGTGYAGLKLRGDITGTDHGLAMRPYIRESRRIKAEFTVLEQHVGVEARPGTRGAEPFHDAVGIGSYRIDLHPSYRRNYLDINNYPHQIPLGALIPVRVENVLPGNKNLGVTHITNGCYRLHPIEWNTGEAAGALAAYCLNHDLAPRQVRNKTHFLNDFQNTLVNTLGFVLEWPDHIRAQDRAKKDPLGI